MDQTEPRSHQDQPQAEHQLDYDQRVLGQGGREDGTRNHSYLESLQGEELGANRDSSRDRNELVQPDRGKGPLPPSQIRRERAGRRVMNGRKWGLDRQKPQMRPTRPLRITGGQL